MVHIAFDSAALHSFPPPVKIECVVLWRDKVLIGLADGLLLTYQIGKGKTPDQRYSLDLLGNKKSFSKKPIVQLCVIEEHDMLLSLSDGNINVHQLSSLTYKNILLKAKGCNLFIVKRMNGAYTICAASKRRLVFFRFDKDSDQWRFTKELSIPDVIKSMAWCPNALILGFKKEYDILDLPDDEISNSDDNASIGSGGSGSGSNRANEEARELFPTGKSQNALCVTLPALQEVLVIKENIGIALSYEGRPTRKYPLSFGEVPACLGFVHPYVVSSGQQLAEIRLLNYRPNQDGLVQHLTITGVKFLSQPSFINFDNTTCDSQENRLLLASERTLHLISMQPFEPQVLSLVRKSEFEDALYLCDLIKNTSNRLSQETINITHLEYGVWLFLQRQYQKAMEHFLETDVDPRVILSLYPDLLPKNSKAPAITPPINIAPNISTLLAEVGERFRAIQALIPFLTARRIPPNASLNEEAAIVAEAVDTALLKSYLAVNEDLVPTFLRIPNRCDISDSEKSLNSNKKYAELVMFYKSKSLHRKALELLQQLGQTKIDPTTQPKNLSGLFGSVEPTIEYLLDLLQPDKQQTNAEDQQLEQRQREKDALVMEFSRWILEVDPMQGYKIFTHSECRIPPKTVLQHLEKIEASSQVGKVLQPPHELRIQYIETAIAEKKNINDLHTDLILLYLKSVTFYRNKTDAANLALIRKKLLAFLTTSNQYNPVELLSKFIEKEYEELYEERALLLSRISQHEEALKIYVHNMGQPALAEKYCEEHYSSDNPEARDVFLKLLEIYLQAPAGGNAPSSAASGNSLPNETKPSTRNVRDAVHLLEKHFMKIDTTKALRLLPQNTPLDELADYFQAILTKNTVLRRDLQIKKNLMRSENQIVREKYIRARSRKVQIESDRSCSACGKRIGNSVFACYPNGTVVHFICCKDKHVDPISGRDFREKV